ncbi:MAG: HEPN/Toprim-associated domain-containing protein [Gammaproteobacteria bacterium]|nr:hypothetical protein [Pseudomonadales bacterium]
MGTEISLDIDGMPITFSKNSRGIDHGELFQEVDRTWNYSEETRSVSPIGDDDGTDGMGRAFCAPLQKVVPRLELLGFTLERLKRDYQSYSKAWHESEDIPLQDLMDFSEYLSFVTAYPLSSLDDTFVSSVSPEGAEAKGRFQDESLLKRIPGYDPFEIHAYSEKSFFSSIIEILHPYSVLRLLAENKENLDANVVWHYGPLVEAGWAEENEFVPCAHRNQTFLIATEGSSDTHILKRAIKVLRPEIKDFFRFIDVSESHPFSGTGSLVKFAEGLKKIDVHNQIVFVLDNDAEGYDAFSKISAMNLLPNMRVMMLPELEEFKTFPCIGPEGENLADINKRAAAIECYLDLEMEERPPAKVRWTNYKKDSDFYQGSLEHKETYMRYFLELIQETSDAESYNLSKLNLVIDALENECTLLASTQL